MTAPLHIPTAPLHIPNEETALFYVRKLIDVYQTTLAPDADPRRKDGLAREALMLSSMLVAGLAGWAIYHTAGRVLNSCPSAIYVHGDGDDSISDDVAKEASDKKHECNGINYEYTFSGRKVEIERKVLAELLSLNPGAFPPSLAAEASEALQALNFGGVHPLMKPAKKRGHGPAYTLARLRLWAIAYVEYLFGTGKRRAFAQDEVALAFGIEGENTLKVWKRNSKHLFGKHADDLLQWARKRGEMHSKGRENLFCPFSDQGLRESGDEYQKLMRHRLASVHEVEGA